MVDYIYKSQHVAVVSDGTRCPKIFLQPNHIGSGRGCSPESPEYGAGWYFDVDKMVEALQLYVDNGYSVQPKTVSVPLSELKAMKARIEELERGAK